MGRLVALVALGVAVVAASVSIPGTAGTDGADERADGSGEGAVLFRDGDLVVYAAKGTGVSAPSVGGDGYTVYRNSTLREHYTIRLIDSNGIERLRPHLESVAATMRDEVGRSVTVAPGVFPADTTTTTGLIDVRVSSAAPCTGKWLGCAAPVVDDGEVRQARVWINPRLLLYSDQSLGNGVRHEMGHAFGLGHFDGEHEGLVQTMHSTSFDAPDYRSGDLNGLRRHLQSAPAGSTPTTAPPPPEPTSAERPTPVGSVDPEGSMTATAGVVGIVIRGHAVDADAIEPVLVTVSLGDQTFSLAAAKLDEATGARNGYEVVWSVAPGTHHVCVTAHNVGAGTDTTLGCDDVVVTPAGVGQLGLQTL